MTDRRRPGRPRTGETPKRYLRVADEVWDQVAEVAAARQETRTALVLRAIERELRRCRTTR